MTTPKLIDAHTHVQFNAYKDDADEVIKRALDAKIWMVNVGSQRTTSERALRFTEKYPEGVYATVGLHPVHTDKSYHDEDEVDGPGFQSTGEDFDYDFYKKLALHPKVVAIGECGLDYYRETGEEAVAKQEEVFRKHIDLSLEVRKPLMIHCRANTKPGEDGRQAFPDLIKILGDYFKAGNSGKPGITHFFSGTIMEAEKLLDMGFFFTFGGVITFVRDYDDIVRLIPLERILVETDAPYVTPAPYRGKRNEPLYVVEVAKKIAELKWLDLERVKMYTVNSTKTVFKLDTEKPEKIFQ